MGRAYLWPVVTLVAVGQLVVPASIKVSEFEKVDVKAIAATINQLVTQNPDKKYILYQTSGHPMLDWYLERLGSAVRTKGFFSRKDDWNFDYPFDRPKHEIEAADLLIVTYAHNRLAHFPKLVKYL